MSELTAFSARDINGRERLEDYAIDAKVTTKGGTELQIALACDGAGGGDAGELAARLTSRTILDYIEISEETDIPKLITRAIQEANRLVYDELNGGGTSTVALVAIDLSEEPYGRMYIASVGDSHIYLVRDKQPVRLNTDHTLANEYVIAGQMSERESENMNNADDLLRSIGMGPQINVDIGFYAERGKKFVPATRAFQLGMKGLAVKQGDTIIAATDGLFTINEDDGTPYLHEKEILMYALENDVEKATKMLMRFASDRQPKDNTAMSMIFVPSSERKSVRAPLSPALKRNLTIAGVLSACMIIALMVTLVNQFSRQQRARGILEQTQSAFEGTINAQSGSLTEAADRIPTQTPTPTPRPRPEASVPNQVGFQFFLNEGDGPVVVGQRYSHPEINYLLMEGEDGVLSNRRVFEPGEYYLQPDTQVRLDNLVGVELQESIEFTLEDDGDVFALNGQFINEGITFNLFDNVNVNFFAETDCIAIRHFRPDPLVEDDHAKVALTCFTGERGDCTYTLGSEDPIEMDIGRRVLIDLDAETLLEIGQIRFEEVRTYFDTVEGLTGERERASCLTPHLDSDGDGVPYPFDLCEDEGEFGQVNDDGCPDQDGDGFPDNVDQCPTIFGPLNGCPLSDIDEDGYPDVYDACPTDNGYDEEGNGFGVDTEGCPLDSLDSDDDGVPDVDDLCPDEGDRSADPDRPAVDENGCPIDTDGDGVPDNVDQCLFIGDSPLGIGPDGCPLTDTDDDGIPDDEDACPTEGDLFGDGVDATGCPISDSDDDGIPDDIDQCPLSPMDDPTSGIITPIDDVGCPLDDDDDGDGVLNGDDICPGGNDNLDLDNDGVPNFCDPDTDGDGIINVNDLCPLQGDEGNGVDATGCPIDPNAIGTPTVVPTNAPIDTDGDGFLDPNDACPTQGPSQFGLDGTGCPIPGGADNDGDGVPNTDDDCPNVAGDPSQAPPDRGCPNTGNSDDPDGDGFDELGSNITDNCPGVYGTAGGCPDADGDGIQDSDDACDQEFGAITGNPDTNGCVDTDGDGVPDNGNDANPSNTDVCSSTAFTADGGTYNPGIASGINGCPDADMDNIPNIIGSDNCPTIASADVTDTDGDTFVGIVGVAPPIGNYYDGTNSPIPPNADVGGDICDDDLDGDGVVNATDNCPSVANADQLDSDPAPSGNGIGDVCDSPSLTDPDDDGDGVADSADICEGSDDNIDTDNDGIPNGCDPDDDNDGDPDASDPDDDGDGVPDGSDQCHGFDDALDFDNDGTPDGCDNDDDNDGLPDSVDPNDNDPTNGLVDSDGDGVPNGSDQCQGFNDNLDSNNNGIPDGCDLDDGDNDDDGLPDTLTLNCILLNNCDYDDDNDGVLDTSDVCPGGDDNIDYDGDHIPDDCDPDDDGDGVSDLIDVCSPGDDTKDYDGDGIPDDCDGDDDGDSVADPPTDQCQGGNDIIDIDGDGIPDDCDPDKDNDGITDIIDTDDDGDGVDDTSDLCPHTLVGATVASNGCDDTDGDTIADNLDNCPLISNVTQTNTYDNAGNPPIDPLIDEGDACDDTDADSINDDTDLCPLLPGHASAGGCPDPDGDGVQTSLDNCPADANPLQEDVIVPGGPGDICADEDTDTIVDANDNCPFISNVGQANNYPAPAGSDAEGDICDNSDGDPINDNIDNCPEVTNPGQEDIVVPGGDGDACGDDDSDTIVDATDNCPFISNPLQEDIVVIGGPGDACGDDDSDTIIDNVDNCPQVAGIAYAPPYNGCPDSDGDGVPDDGDNCPAVSNPLQEDFDGDGFTPFPIPPPPPGMFYPSGGDACDTDDDNDGILDINETPACINDPNCRPNPPPPLPPAPTSAPIVAPTTTNDSDGDGVPDNLDICPRGDDNIDSDKDGIPDACDTP